MAFWHRAHSDECYFSLLFPGLTPVSLPESELGFEIVTQIIWEPQKTSIVTHIVYLILSLWGTFSLLRYNPCSETRTKGSLKQIQKRKKKRKDNGSSSVRSSNPFPRGGFEWCIINAHKRSTNHRSTFECFSAGLLGTTKWPTSITSWSKWR